MIVRLTGSEVRFYALNFSRFLPFQHHFQDDIWQTFPTPTSYESYGSTRPLPFEQYELLHACDL